MTKTKNLNTEDPFSIVPDPSLPKSKRLTFEEGVKALVNGKKLYINFGQTLLTDEGLGVYGRYINASDKEDKDKQIFYLDLAERRGWAIEEVEE